MSKARDLSNFISDATVDASEIADLAVTHAKLHTDMNLSSKTLTFAANQISGNAIDGGVISNFASTGIDDNSSSTALTITSGGNVGIGIVDPTADLQLGGSNPNLVFGTTGNELTYLQRYNDDFYIYNKETTGKLFLGTANQTRLTVNETGQVGIGTAFPQTKLHVTGSWATNHGTLSIDGPLNGLAGIGIRGNSTYQGALIWRDGSSGNHLELNSYNANPLYLKTDNTNRISITGTGNVGIGTNNPGAPLEVHHATVPIVKIKATSSSGQAALYLDGYSDGGSTQRASRINFRKDTTTEWSIINDYTQNDSNRLDFEYAGGSKITFTGDGNVGIGTTSPTSKLTIEDGLPGLASTNAGNVSIIYQGGDVAGNRGGGIDFRQRWWSGSTDVVKTGMISGYKTGGSGIHGGGLAFWTKPHDGSDLSHTMTLSGLGRVGIGTTGPNATLEVRNSTTATDSIIASAGLVTAGHYHDLIVGDGPNYAVGLRRYITQSNPSWLRPRLDFIVQGANSYLPADRQVRMSISDTGAVSVPGSLSKGSGSFKIDHPLPSKTETHDLVHSFVESPQANNIYRGKVVLVDGSATINIDTVSGMTDGTYVLLNTNTQCFTSNETGWTAVKGSVSGNTLTINSEVSCTDTISWMVIGERHDQHMIDTDWTNEEGKVIVEPLKENEPE